MELFWSNNGLNTTFLVLCSYIVHNIIFKELVKIEHKYRRGTYSESEIVHMLGTDAQQKRYNKLNHFEGSLKSSVLDNALRYCQLIDNGNRTYTITKVYKDCLPENIKKMKKGIYNTLIPVLLTLLINHKDKYDNFNFTVLNFANMIRMVNDNYLPMSKNIDYTNDKLQISKIMLIEYFKRIDNFVSYYITHAMDLLEVAEIATWQEFRMVCEIHTDAHLKLNQSGSVNGSYKVDTHVSTSYRLATQEEIAMIETIKKDIQTELAINNTSDCYFGKKAKDYITRYREELLKHDILFDFKMYRLQFQPKSIEKSKLLLNTYDDKTELQRIRDFNIDFQKLITELAEKRYNKDIEKYSNEYSDKYIDFYQLLTETTIDNKTKVYGDLPKIKNPIDYDSIEMYLNNENVKYLGE